MAAARAVRGLEEYVAGLALLGIGSRISADGPYHPRDSGAPGWSIGNVLFVAVLLLSGALLARSRLGGDERTGR